MTPFGAVLGLLFIGPILINCVNSNYYLGDSAQTNTFAATYCGEHYSGLAIGTADLETIYNLCQKQAANTMSGTDKECWIGGKGLGSCMYIKQDKGFGSDCDSGTARPFVCDDDAINSAAGEGSPFNMAILPSDDIGGNELVCVEYKYYMAICVLLMIAFASFLCFIVVALNKLKQLRES
eukprot:358983_1